MVETEVILGNVLPYILPLWKNPFRVKCKIGSPYTMETLSAKLKVPMVSMVHTCENTMYEEPTGKLCYEDREAFHCLDLVQRYKGHKTDKFSV